DHHHQRLDRSADPALALLPLLSNPRDPSDEKVWTKPLEALVASFASIASVAWCVCRAPRRGVLGVHRDTRKRRCTQFTPYARDAKDAKTGYRHSRQRGSERYAFDKKL